MTKIYAIIPDVQADIAYLERFGDRIELTEIRWCETHKSTVIDPIEGDPDSCCRYEWEPYIEEEFDEPCRIITKLIIDVPETSPPST